MPKTLLDLSEILQVRISPGGLKSIKDAATADGESVAAWSRRVLLKAAKATKGR